LTTKISELELRLDEEDLRAWSLASIELAVLNSRRNIINIDTEMAVLASKPADPVPQQSELPPDPDRLDRIPRKGLPTSGPLLSGDGKVMRPFVLTSKRDQFSQGVFRPDHSLPTMSVDDYLTEEIRRGGIQVPQDDDTKTTARVKSGREEEEEEDRETLKKREWDDYTESHAKGSGNMGFNRG
jgi:immunoglobulin-binding protein 1